MKSHIVAIESEIRHASLARSRLKGMDLVIWRGTSGNIHVWQDHNPHRSVRLSAGRNMGSYLEDIYHGWQFAEDGHVQLIPAEGKAFPEIRANVLPSVVAAGFVWVGEAAADVPGGSIGRPVHIRAAADTIDHFLNGDFFITPWGENEAMVYPITNDARTTHTELLSLRDKLESHS